MDNDISLLRLAKSAKCNKRVAPACLTSGEPTEKDSVTVSGWGTTKEGGKQPKKLMKVTVPIVDRDVCNGKDWYDGEISENMICAGLEEGGKDSCQGDSGGKNI